MRECVRSRLAYSEKRLVKGMERGQKYSTVQKTGQSKSIRNRQGKKAKRQRAMVWYGRKVEKAEGNGLVW